MICHRIKQSTRDPRLVAREPGPMERSQESTRARITGFIQARFRQFRPGIPWQWVTWIRCIVPCPLVVSPLLPRDFSQPTNGSDNFPRIRIPMSTFHRPARSGPKSQLINTMCWLSEIRFQYVALPDLPYQHRWTIKFTLLHFLRWSTPFGSHPEVPVSVD